jgi:hypothetical protein
VIQDREQLHEAWQEWVAANLGRDGARTAAAAAAATDAALGGAGFDAATEAAREAWRTSGPALTTSSPASREMPRTLLVAMSIAMGGGVASLVLAAWIGTELSSVSSVAAFFFLFNLAIVGINAGVLAGMRRRSRRAWTTAVVLVLVGSLFDAVEWLTLATTLSQSTDANGLGTAAMIAAPALLISLGVAVVLLLMNLPLGVIETLSNNWLGIHLLVIQLPILVLLLVSPSRSWFRPRAV